MGRTHRNGNREFGPKNTSRKGRQNEQHWQKDNEEDDPTFYGIVPGIWEPDGTEESLSQEELDKLNNK